jgi:uncharacterized phage protein (TIGR02218 family)
VRAFSPEFAAHLLKDGTTLATCWRLTRADSLVLGFTDHDQPLSFDGTRFEATGGLAGSEGANKLGAQIDTSEISGIITSDRITATDIEMGRYDGARVEIFRVNWMNLSERARLGTATIGTITREDRRFTAELRADSGALNTAGGRVYSALCDAELGDARCTVSLAASGVDVRVLATNDRHRLTVAGLEGASPERFTAGLGRWLSGPRAGLVDRIATIERRGTADIIGFTEPVSDFVKPDDRLRLSPGCDRRFATCRDVFANSINFRGFPHVPGTDFVLRLPKTGDTLNGGALVS